LLNLNATVDANNFNILLENYGLNNFQHRLFISMAAFIYNIVNIEQAPQFLRDQIGINFNMDKGDYNLRNKFQVNKPLKIHNHYGEATFVYFCSKFINNIIPKDLKNNFVTFRKLPFCKIMSNISKV
jgi:hypothetical protein